MTNPLLKRATTKRAQTKTEADGPGQRQRWWQSWYVRGAIALLLVLVVIAALFLRNTRYSGHGATGIGHALFNAVSATSASDVWAVGTFAQSGVYRTLTEHYNGRGWALIASPNPGAHASTLAGVVALSSSDIWAVGGQEQADYSNDPLIMHWDGVKWDVVPSPAPTPKFGTYATLYGVSAISATDIWAVGTVNNNFSLIEHWDGTTWSIVAHPEPGSFEDIFRDIYALSSSNVWAVGSYENLTTQYDENGLETVGPLQTLIEHWDGARWSVIRSPNDGELAKITALSSSDIWAFGNVIEHWDGTNWSIIKTLNDAELQGAGAVSASDIWAAGYALVGGVSRTLLEHWDGTRWAMVASPNEGVGANKLTAIVAIASANIWAVGAYSTTSNLNGLGSALVEHWNGVAWSIVAVQA